MRVVLKVQRKDGVYVTREFHMADDMPYEGIMMTKECMVIGSAFRSMYGQVQLMPEKQEEDEL